MERNDDITMKIKMGDKCFPSIRDLKEKKVCNENEIEDLLKFIDLRLDCADFRMVPILRTLYDYSGSLSKCLLEKMKKTILAFKYWMDEPGEDSMCYWSENHQLLFATVEYLAGSYYRSEVFTNSGMTGEEHVAKAKMRLDLWFSRRFEYGFTEWLSNTYYEEDAAPLSLLIDLAEDKEIRKKAEIALNLIFIDMAMHTFEMGFSASSGRCYEAQKKYPEKQDTRDMTAYLLGLEDYSYDYRRLSTELLLNRSYRMPDIIRAIARDEGRNLTRCTHGLDLKEIRKEFKGRREIEDKGAYLWAMEAFSNKESINTSMKMFKLYHLEKNIFLSDLDMVSSPVLRKLGLLPLLVRILNPATQGVAIERANTETLRTGDYMLSSAQMHHPQGFGDQQHIWQASLKGGISVFTTHPAVSGFEDNARNFSPGYWVGSGILPSVLQDENRNLVLYDLRVRKGFLENRRSCFTHAFFPFRKFDEYEFLRDGRLLIARKEKGYIALFSLESMNKKDEEEILQEGKVTGWATLMGSKEENGSYEDFSNQASSYSLCYEKGRLRFKRNGREELAVSNRKAWIGGREESFNYPRLDSSYGHLGRKCEVFSIRHEGQHLSMDFNTLEIKEG